MGVAGSISPPGGAPKPDPERVATIRYTLVDEPETCAAFGESAHATLASLNDRTLAEARNGDLGECSLLLDHVRDRLGGLDPARLQPRTGLAGLFDSRNKRLKEFRAAWTSAAASMSQSAADIGDRAGALAHKNTALETLWSETRDAIAELDAHIAAARSWLANEAPAAPIAQPVEAPLVTEAAEERVADEAPAPAEDAPYAPIEAQAEAHDHAPVVAVMAEPEQIEPVEDVVEIASVAEGSESEAVALSEADEPPATEASVEAAEPVETALTEVAPEASAEPAIEAVVESEAQAEPTPAPASAPIASLPHPLETRLAALEAVRATAIGRLPLLRAAQNADCRAPGALKEVCDGVEAWRADWQDALGLAGKRPKKVVPDRTRLTAASTALTDRIHAAGRELSAAQARRTELDARAAPPEIAASLAA